MYVINKITSHHVVDFAAEELKKYLRMMMPRCGEIDIAYAADAKEGFRLGLMTDFGLDTSEASDLGLDDIIHIDTDAEGGIIAGSNPRSVLLAVYRYLYLNGCRWLFPGIDGEFIPVKGIEPTKYHKMADCRYRGQCNEGAETQPQMMACIDYAPKIGMNVFMLEHDMPLNYYKHFYDHQANEANREVESVTRQTSLQWKRQCEAEFSKRGLQFHDMGHGWTTEALCMKQDEIWSKNTSADVLSDECKEYLALIDGKRDFFDHFPLNTNFCMSNPKARKNVVDAIVRYAEKGTNVDYLHVWLADAVNNHCECEECSKMTPSDWYMVLMNEADEALTAKNLKTRIVFIAYVDTTWAPEVVTLKNPDRFTLLLAAISRNYSIPVDIPPPKLELPRYKRNKNVLPADVNVYVAYAKEWAKRCRVQSFAYEYHYWRALARDLGLFDSVKLIHQDILGYKANGVNGIVEDGTQRGYYPNGFKSCVYAGTLFDNSLDLEAYTADYFRHAYGENYETVIKFFEDIGKAVDFRYLHGKMSADPEKGDYYNPELADSFRKVRGIVAKFKPFVDEHRQTPYRAQTVAYRMLARYLEFVLGITEALILKCKGCDYEAFRAYKSFMDKFGAYEIEMEDCYDHFMFNHSLTSVFGKEASFANLAD